MTTLAATMTEINPASFADAAQSTGLATRATKPPLVINVGGGSVVIHTVDVKPNLSPVKFTVLITENTNWTTSNIFAEQYPYHCRTYRGGKALESVGFDSMADARLYAEIVADRVGEGHQPIWG